MMAGDLSVLVGGSVRFTTALGSRMWPYRIIGWRLSSDGVAWLYLIDDDGEVSSVEAGSGTVRVLPPDG